MIYTSITIRCPHNLHCKWIWPRVRSRDTSFFHTGGRRITYTEQMFRFIVTEWNFRILSLFTLQCQFQYISLSKQSFSLYDKRKPIRIMILIFLLLYLNNLDPLGICTFPSPLKHINLFASMGYFLKATEFYV